jgi:hypothetical protein
VKALQTIPDKRAGTVSHHCPQHRLNFFPLPQGQRALRSPVLSVFMSIVSGHTSTSSSPPRRCAPGRESLAVKPTTKEISMQPFCSERLPRIVFTAEVRKPAPRLDIDGNRTYNPLRYRYDRDPALFFSCIVARTKPVLKLRC